MATAPTLLLTPRDAAAGDDAASTSRIVTSSTMPPEDPQWFKTGTTLPPPSMRPMAESAAPPAVHDVPNPRVLKIVAGVIGGCLFIVALAGAKLLYKRSQAPANPPSTEVSASLATPPMVANLAPSGSEAAPLGNLARAPETAPPSTAAQPAAAAPVAQTTPRRPSPTRVTAKPSTRRPPVPKKVGKSTH